VATVGSIGNDDRLCLRERSLWGEAAGSMTLKSESSQSAVVELELPSAKDGVSVASPDPKAKPSRASGD
jgi:hypothetical protein